MTPVLREGRLWRVVVCSTLVLLLAATETGWAKISPGDVVVIRVHSYGDLDVELPVPPGGKVLYPVVGELVLAGRTVPEVCEELRKRLKEAAHISQPVVTAFIRSRATKKLYIYGAVARPQELVMPAEGGLSLSRAVAIAGGLLPGADERRVKITRTEPPSVLRVDFEAVSASEDPIEDIPLEPGDVVYVPEREKVYVLGQVKNPCAYSVPSGKVLTVSKAVSLAGGFTRYARYARVRVTRRTGEGVKSFTVDVGEVMAKGVVEKDLELEPGDLVFVPERIF